MCVLDPFIILPQTKGECQVNNYQQEQTDIFFKLHHHPLGATLKQVLSDVIFS